MDTDSTLGLIGLGIMGRPMARNLMKAGYPLVVHDVNQAAVEELVADGATAGRLAPTGGRDNRRPDHDAARLSPGPRGLSRLSGRVRSPPAGLAGHRHEFDRAIHRTRAGGAGGSRGRGHPRCARERRRDKGAITLGRCPSWSAAGRLRSSRRCRFSRPWARPSSTSAAGAGQVVKVCNQVTVAVVMEAMSEALVLGAKAGVDPAKIADVLQGGLAAAEVLEMRRANMLGGTFDPGFRVRLHQKDLKGALDLAREIDVVLPAAAQVDQHIRAMSAAGREDYDHSGLITVLEDLAAFRVTDATGGSTPPE